jgi:hypothetical protein
MAEPRTEVYQIRFSTEEKKLVEDFARKQGLKVADYIRIAVMFDMIMGGDVRMIRHVGRELAVKVNERLRTRWRELMAGE